MIRVVCEACGARFRAKREFAGRRGKCPQCGEPVVVPAADPDDEAETEAEAESDEGTSAQPAAPARPKRAAAPPRKRPVAAPPPVDEDEDEDEVDDAEDEGAEEDVPAVVSSRRGRRGGRRGSGRRRSPKTVPARASLAAGARLAGVQRRRSSMLVIVAVLLVFAVAAWFLMPMLLGKLETTNFFADGQHALSQARYDEAIAQLEQVPPDAGNYAQAQELLERARSERDLAASSGLARQEGKLWNWIVVFNDNQLSAYDADEELYASYARFLLIRLAELAERFPDGVHAADARKMETQLSAVASLSRRPSEMDIDTEVLWRNAVFQFGEAWAAVQAWATANPGEHEVVRDWQQQIEIAAKEQWQRTEDKLRSGGDLVPGSENWANILSKTMGYLELVEGVPGVGREAQQLYDKARRAAEG